MKRIFIVSFLAIVIATDKASAQGAWPIYYNQLIGNTIFDAPIMDTQFIWDEVVRQEQGMCQNIVKPGVKKIVICTDAADTNPNSLVCEFYPNGLIKTFDRYTFNYNRRWQLTNIMYDDGEIAAYYSYDTETSRLTKTICNSYVYTYNYDQQGNLESISKGVERVLGVKNNQLTKLNLFGEVEYSYDASGRISGKKYLDEGMDDFTWYCEVSYAYNSGFNMPSTITTKRWDYDWETERKTGTPQTSVTNCLYKFDDCGNWIQWQISTKQYGESVTVTVNRDITYYSDEEVKTALEQLEASRKPTEEAPQEEEELWSY